MMDDKTVRIRDTATGDELAVLRGDRVWTSASLNPDMTRIVTASLDKTARVWDSANGDQLTVLHGHENWLNSASFSPRRNPDCDRLRG